MALKTLEGALRFMFDTILGVIATDDATRAAGDVLLGAPRSPSPPSSTPTPTGGAMLLGVEGVSVISHGSSSARAVKNALRVAHDLAEGGVVDALARRTSRLRERLRGAEVRL